MQLVYDSDVFDYSTLPSESIISPDRLDRPPSRSPDHLASLTFSAYHPEPSNQHPPSQSKPLKNSSSAKTLRSDAPPRPLETPRVESTYELLAFLHQGSTWDVWLARRLHSHIGGDGDSDTGTIIFVDPDNASDATSERDDATIRPDSLVVLKIHRSRLTPAPRESKSARCRAVHEISLYDGPLRPLWDEVVPVFHGAWTTSVAAPIYAPSSSAADKKTFPTRRHTVLFDSPAKMGSPMALEHPITARNKGHKPRASIPDWYQDYIGVDNQPPPPASRPRHKSLGLGLPPIHESDAKLPAHVHSPKDVRPPSTDVVNEPRRASTASTATTGTSTTARERRVSLHRPPDTTGVLPRRLSTLINEHDLEANTSLTDLEGRVSIRVARRVSVPRAPAGGGVLPRTAGSLTRLSHHIRQMSIPSISGSIKLSRPEIKFAKHASADTQSDEAYEGGAALERVWRAPSYGKPQITDPLPFKGDEEILIMVLQFLPGEWNERDRITVDEVPSASSVRYTFTGQARLVDFADARILPLPADSRGDSRKPMGRSLRASISIKQSLNQLPGKPATPVMPLPPVSKGDQHWQTVPELADEADRVWTELVEKTGVAAQLRERYRLEQKRGGRRLWEGKVELWRGEETVINPAHGQAPATLLSLRSRPDERKEKGKTWSGMSVQAKYGDHSLVNPDISTATDKTQEHWGTASKISSILNGIHIGPPSDLTLAEKDILGELSHSIGMDEMLHRAVTSLRTAGAPDTTRLVSQTARTTGAKPIEGLPVSASTPSRADAAPLWSAGTPIRPPRSTYRASQLSLLDKRHTLTSLPLRMTPISSSESIAAAEGEISRFSADTRTDMDQSISAASDQMALDREMSQSPERVVDLSLSASPEPPRMAETSHLAPPSDMFAAHRQDSARPSPELADLVTPNPALPSSLTFGPLSEFGKGLPSAHAGVQASDYAAKGAIDGRHWLVSPALPSPTLSQHAGASEKEPRPRARHQPTFSLSMADKRQRRMAEVGELQKLMLRDEDELEAIILGGGGGGGGRNATRKGDGVGLGLGSMSVHMAGEDRRGYASD